MTGLRSVGVSGLSKATIGSSVTPDKAPLLRDLGQRCCLVPSGTRTRWGAVNRSTTPGTPGESEPHRGLVRAQLDQAGVAAVHLALCKALEVWCQGPLRPPGFQFPYERVNCVGPRDSGR